MTWTAGLQPGRAAGRPAFHSGCCSVSLEKSSPAAGTAAPRAAGAGRSLPSVTALPRGRGARGRAARSDAIPGVSGGRLCVCPRERGGLSQPPSASLFWTEEPSPPGHGSRGRAGRGREAPQPASHLSALSAPRWDQSRPRCGGTGKMNVKPGATAYLVDPRKRELLATQINREADVDYADREIKLQHIDPQVCVPAE